MTEQHKEITAQLSFSAVERPELLSPITLAFVGDAVFELLTRQSLAAGGTLPADTLHKESVARVCASAQSAAAERIEPLFTPEEAEIFRRGRNCTGVHVPKSASSRDYRRATALEALFGYLWLTGQSERITQLFAAMGQ